MMKKKSLLLFTLLSISLSALSHANQHGAANGSKCEDMSHASFGIAHFDSNKDGSISLQEYLSGDSANTEKTYQHIDANSDGMLDKEEQQEIEAVYKSIHNQHKAKNNSI